MALCQFYHGLLPPPSSLQQFPGHVQAQREAYNALRRQHLVAPDGRWAADCTGGSEHQDSSPLPRLAIKGKEKAWDPLNLEGEVC
jgi:TBC1 domain family protein 5